VALNLETLLLLATVGLLLILRFDARRFGAAEYDDEEAPGGLRTWVRRLSWYASGIGLVFVVYCLYPMPLTMLHLQMGEPRPTVLLGGLAIGGAGAAFAALYAWWRYGELRLPPAHRYAAGILNSVGTAFIDEAAFRGIVLGLLLVSNWPVELAIGFQAVLYALSTRLAATGRPRGMLILSLGTGLVCGWLTVETGGIGGAFLGHALVRFAIFVATGHVGALRASSPAEDEFLPHDEDAPAGWERVGDHEPGVRDAYRP
jgi:hypothetical protein